MFSTALLTTTVILLATLPSTLALQFIHHDASLLHPRDGTGSVTSTAGLAWYDSVFTHGNAGKTNTGNYTCFSGPASNFPAMSTWINFNAMWTLQLKVALKPIGDSVAEQNAIYGAIVNMSQVAKVDARVILAVVILESTGNPRVNCTTSYSGVLNCGLMQSYNPTIKTYNASQVNQSISQMIRDGTQGTANGPGLVQYFNDASDTPKETNGNVYAVMRSYNSGAVNATNLSDGEGANNGYVSHIANYLQGWDGTSAGYQNCSFMPKPSSTSTPTCASSAYVAAPTQTVSGTTSHCCKWATVKSGDTCASIDTAAGISLTQFRAWNTYIDAACDNLWLNYTYCVSSNGTTSSSSSSTTATPTSTPTGTCASSAYVAAPTQTVAGTTSDCCKWYTVKSGDTCATLDSANGISLAQFRAWNTYIDAACDNLWLNYAYCVSSNDPVPTTSTTTKTSTSKKATSTTSK